MSASLHAPPGRVLSTLNADGSRRWIRPRPAHGPFWSRRRGVAVLLMLVFVLLPHVRLAGKPIVLLDLPRREFTLLGTTFLPTETLLFMLLSVAALVAIFLVTALWGRVWCGWGCPQTVYLEFLFRPIEYAIEGGPRGVLALDARGGLPPRRLLKYAVFLLLSMALAHTFLAYFVGVDRLADWVGRSPVEHPTSFAVMLGTTALMFLDFAWFREQTCLVACPYGRLQSVLLDRRSKIVGYDARRGEPRAHGRTKPAGAGDCVDCAMCVQTCPTGIDIREGLQMECVHCTQCMDACDAVMVRIGRPPGLIRYGSRDEFEGRPSGLLRTRVIVYPLVLAAALGALGWQLAGRTQADVTVLRVGDQPFTTDASGRIVNLIRVKIVNRGAADARYLLALEALPEARLVAPMNPVPVAAGRSAETTVFVSVPASALPNGERDVRLSVSDERGARRVAPIRLIGPEPAERVGARR